MHERINKVLHRTLQGFGIEGREYTVDISKYNRYDTKHETYAYISDGKKRVSTEGPFSSRFDMGLKIGRKRIIGRLEYLIGTGCWAEGLYRFGEFGFPANPTNDEGMLLLTSIAMIGIGSVMQLDGRIRKDIASSVINKLNRKKTPNAHAKN